MGADKLIHEMELILDQLVHNASIMNEMSVQIISEDELNGLQKKQDKLIEQLLKANEEFEKTNLPNQPKDENPALKEIQKKLREFERLNNSFIEHINSNEGIIQFEEEKPSKKHKYEDN